MQTKEQVSWKVMIGENCLRFVQKEVKEARVSWVFLLVKPVNQQITKKDCHE